jgi:hypothetical protein
MKKYALLALLAALTINVVNAQEGPKGPPPGPRPPMTEAQKKVQAEMVAKYDTNKNGKLDREERLKISSDDRKKMREAIMRDAMGGRPGGGPRRDGMGPHGKGPMGPRPPHDGPPPRDHGTNAVPVK